MAKHFWTILCSKASVDQFTGSLSLFDVIEQVTVEPVPPDGEIVAMPMSFVLVTFVRRDDSAKGEQQIARADLVFPDGTEISGAEFKIDLEAKPRARHLLHSAVLPVKGIGTHRFLIKFLNAESGQWNAVAECEFEVEASGAAGETSAGTIREVASG